MIQTSTMQVDVVDSESQLFSGVVEHLVAPAVDGEIGIYPNHMPIIAKLKPGVLRLKLTTGDLPVVFAISGGFLEVCENHATILADIVERTDELDEERLKQQQADAVAKLKRSDSSPTADVAKAQISLDIAIAQLKALDYIKKHSNRS